MPEIGLVDGRRMAVPRSLRIVALMHVVCVVLLCSSAFVSCSETVAISACLHLPQALTAACGCSPISRSGAQTQLGISLFCKGLNATSDFDFSESGSSGSGEEKPAAANDIGGGSGLAPRYQHMLAEQVLEVSIHDSEIDVLRLQDFALLKHLQHLSVTRSKVRSVVGLPRGQLRELQRLDLGENNIAVLDENVLNLKQLLYLNMSRNLIHNVTVPFERMEKLRDLDLSSNRLSSSLNPQILIDLPPQLQTLDIWNNSWECTPQLSWMFSWTEVAAVKRVLLRPEELTCVFEGHHEGSLLVVMEHYTKHVTPTCPSRDNCTCLLTSMQTRLVTSSERVYSVRVDCSGQGLTHFPKLPKHTRSVDLSRNKLDARSFVLLRVQEHNYDEVDNVTLDNNSLESLSEKLLDIKLGLGFSARQNKLTSIPYDFSQHLLKSTSVIHLAHNPWKCACRSQITDLTLLAKIRDRDDIVCGPGSDIIFVNKKVVELNQELLCPPETTGEGQELMLQMLCALLALLLVVTLTKLAYDYWVYRTRGQLPWIVLKMP